MATEDSCVAGLAIACTGFVSERAGSVASANALLLRALLDLGVEVTFFSKPTFVDPRPAVGAHPRFCFHPVVNRTFDTVRRHAQGIPVVGSIAKRCDAASYNRMLVNYIQRWSCRRKCDLVLWLGDYAHGSVSGTPTVSFAQGPPGTDARSVFTRRAEIHKLAGWFHLWKWMALASMRLSRAGLPALRHSDHIIVGSQQSCRTLNERYGIPSENLSALPYPIDLDLFKPNEAEQVAIQGSKTVRALWLGRFVPRKRLELFLDGAAIALQQGMNLQLSIFGDAGFIGGYERLLASFPFPDRLTWNRSIARTEVPRILRQHDFLVQPSDEEDFGSSVAEAQACGLPVVVGRTNGNADYLCSRDIHLADDRPKTLADALREMTARKNSGRWGTIFESRLLAEKKFALAVVTGQLMKILQRVAHRSRPSKISA